MRSNSLQNIHSKQASIQNVQQQSSEAAKKEAPFLNAVVRYSHASAVTVARASGLILTESQSSEVRKALAATSTLEKEKQTQGAASTTHAVAQASTSASAEAEGASDPTYHLNISRRALNRSFPDAWNRMTEYNTVKDEAEGEEAGAAAPRQGIKVKDCAHPFSRINQTRCNENKPKIKERVATTSSTETLKAPTKTQNESDKQHVTTQFLYWYGAAKKHYDAALVQQQALTNYVKSDYTPYWQAVNQTSQRKHQDILLKEHQDILLSNGVNGDRIKLTIDLHNQKQQLLRLLREEIKELPKLIDNRRKLKASLDQKKEINPSERAKINIELLALDSQIKIKEDKKKDKDKIIHKVETECQNLRLKLTRDLSDLNVIHHALKEMGLIQFAPLYFEVLKRDKQLRAEVDGAQVEITGKKDDIDVPQLNKSISKLSTIYRGLNDSEKAQFIGLTQKKLLKDVDKNIAKGKKSADHALSISVVESVELQLAMSYLKKSYELLMKESSGIPNAEERKAATVDLLAHSKLLESRLNQIGKIYDCSAQSHFLKVEMKGLEEELKTQLEKIKLPNVNQDELNKIKMESDVIQLEMNDCMEKARVAEEEDQPLSQTEEANYQAVRDSFVACEALQSELKSEVEKTALILKGDRAGVLSLQLDEQLNLTAKAAELAVSCEETAKSKDANLSVVNLAVKTAEEALKDAYQVQSDALEVQQKAETECLNVTSEQRKIISDINELVSITEKAAAAVKRAAEMKRSNQTKIDGVHAALVELEQKARGEREGAEDNATEAENENTDLTTAERLLENAKKQLSEAEDDKNSANVQVQILTDDGLALPTEDAALQNQINQHVDAAQTAVEHIELVVARLTQLQGLTTQLQDGLNGATKAANEATQSKASAENEISTVADAESAANAAQAAANEAKEIQTKAESQLQDAQNRGFAPTDEQRQLLDAIKAQVAIAEEAAAAVKRAAEMKRSNQTKIDGVHAALVELEQKARGEREGAEDNATEAENENTDLTTAERLLSATQKQAQAIEQQQKNANAQVKILSDANLLIPPAIDELNTSIGQHLEKAQAAVNRIQRVLENKALDFSIVSKNIDAAVETAEQELNKVEQQASSISELKTSVGIVAAQIKIIEENKSLVVERIQQQDLSAQNVASIQREIQNAQSKTTEIHRMIKRLILSQQTAKEAILDRFTEIVGDKRGLKSWVQSHAAAVSAITDWETKNNAKPADEKLDLQKMFLPKISRMSVIDSQKFDAEKTAQENFEIFLNSIELPTPEMFNEDINAYIVAKIQFEISNLLLNASFLDSFKVSDGVLSRAAMINAFSTSAEALKEKMRQNQILVLNDAAKRCNFKSENDFTKKTEMVLKNNEIVEIRELDIEQIEQLKDKMKAINQSKAPAERIRFNWKLILNHGAARL